MEITFHTQDVELPNINQDLLNEWLPKVASFYNKEIGEITYIFCSDPVILEINQQYLNHDYYTDIISFDYTEGNVVSGDLFIGLETIQSNASKYQTSFTEELHRVLIHGVLHLCGIDDQTPEQRVTMEKEENRALLLIRDYLTA
ncbi:MAG: rRNA maturation RNase YbeY [Bacteroidales bacterium]|nr:rRNA maturation RNase YbeY [Bacteroidales bacterium]